MSKGFLWFCQNNDKTDYVELSLSLAKSIKRYNKHNKVCVITDSKTKINSPLIDEVQILGHDESENDDIKWANEYKAFTMSPFKHTIKLAADMLWTANTDWWWNYLCRHELVFSVDCYNYQDKLVRDRTYRPHHDRNQLPNLYSDLTYFRHCSSSRVFGHVCKYLTKNWKTVREQMLIGCHDRYPSTDMVYALAYRIMDPVKRKLINYPWFKMIHNKKAVNKLDRHIDQNSYLLPTLAENKLFLGGYAVTRPWHYVDKHTIKDIYARIF